jgi:hypothetical protein
MALVALLRGDDFFTGGRVGNSTPGDERGGKGNGQSHGWVSRSDGHVMKRNNRARLRHIDKAVGGSANLSRAGNKPMLPTRP